MALGCETLREGLERASHVHTSFWRSMVIDARMASRSASRMRSCPQLVASAARAASSRRCSGPLSLRV